MAAIDNRLISLNLFLNRIDAHLPLPSEDSSFGQIHVYDQQEAIANLHKKGKSADAIAQTLDLPKGEVDLVLDLKKKLLDMK